MRIMISWPASKLHLFPHQVMLIMSVCGLDTSGTVRVATWSHCQQKLYTCICGAALTLSVVTVLCFMSDIDKTSRVPCGGAHDRLGTRLTRKWNNNAHASERSEYISTLLSRKANASQSRS